MIVKKIEKIILKDIEKIYRFGHSKCIALQHINIEIEQGEFMAIIGPSGSGKTTLLNLIGCLDKPCRGQVDIFGRDVSSLSNKQASELRKKSIGFIFQTYNLLPIYTVYENVEFALLLLHKSKQERQKMVYEALEWLGLADKAHVKPSQLSGGQCQRVSIARAIVKKPKIILADEPTANLDKENSIMILEMMKKMNTELGTTFIFSTHDEKVISVVERHIELEDGQIRTTQ